MYPTLALVQHAASGMLYGVILDRNPDTADCKPHIMRASDLLIAEEITDAELTPVPNWGVMVDDAIRMHPRPVDVGNWLDREDYDLLAYNGWRMGA